MAAPSATRRPQFLTSVVGGQEIEPASFKSRTARPDPPALDPLAGRAPTPSHDHPSPTPPPPAAPPAELIARYEAAIDTLRRQCERLAEQTRADAIEIAFQVARKLLETELMTNPEPLFTLIRAAVQKLGETRRITIRVSPADLAVMKGERGQQEQSLLRVAQVDLLGDPTLARGDCVVESPVGAVDGRLSTRLAEMRRAVAEAIDGEAA